jgi:hypothetical protein
MGHRLDFGKVFNIIHFHQIIGITAAWNVFPLTKIRDCGLIACYISDEMRVKKLWWVLLLCYNENKESCVDDCLKRMVRKKTVFLMLLLIE